MKFISTKQDEPILFTDMEYFLCDYSSDTTVMPGELLNQIKDGKVDMLYQTSIGPKPIREAVWSNANRDLEPFLTINDLGFDNTKNYVIGFAGEKDRRLCASETSYRHPSQLVNLAKLLDIVRLQNQYNSPSVTSLIALPVNRAELIKELTYQLTKMVPLVVDNEISYWFCESHLTLGPVKPASNVLIRIKTIATATGGTLISEVVMYSSTSGWSAELSFPLVKSGYDAREISQMGLVGMIGINTDDNCRQLYELSRAIYNQLAKS